MSTESLIGRKVYCRRNGVTGSILSMNDDVIVILIGTGEAKKTITPSTFKRWYTVVPEEQDAPSKVVDPPADVVEKEVEQNSPTAEVSNPGNVGIEVRNKFISLVKQLANQKLELVVNEKTKRDVIKYNGKNVFECSYSKHKYTVMCHADSLTADNLKRASRVVPKEWGWSLRAKFTFDSVREWPLMKTIIADGLFYRQIEEAPDEGRDTNAEN